MAGAENPPGAHELSLAAFVASFPLWGCQAGPHLTWIQSSVPHGSWAGHSARDDAGTAIGSLAREGKERGGSSYRTPPPTPVIGPCSDCCQNIQKPK